MQKKRKLTASFGEIKNEKDSLERSWRTGEHSDWTLVLGPQQYTIHKVIVATGERASAFLAASFRKHCGQREQTDLSDLVPKKCWCYFEAVLDFVYDANVDITVGNWAPLLKMADQLQIGSLYKMCVESGTDLINPETAPRIASAVVELQIGGELQQQVIQISVEVMAQQFASYRPADLMVLPPQVFQALLRRDDLEVANEDQVFDILESLSREKDVSKEHMTELWKCCRLHALSAERVLTVALINEIPKEAVGWALARRAASQSLKPLAPPLWVGGWADERPVRGREISFWIRNPSVYAPKKCLRSPERQLCEKFKWGLLVFPLGTESTGFPKQVAAFVEILPEAGVEPNWTFTRVKYSITLVNFFDETKSITKDHVFDFTASEVDNGWHRGWVTAENLNTSQGWLNENSDLCFRATICIQSSDLSLG